MERMSARLSHCAVLPSSAMGVDPRQKEAIAFALIGYLSMHGLSGAIPSCTGSATAEILGAFTPGSRPLVMPEPLTQYPEKLTIVS